MKKFLILLALLPSFFIHAQNPVINLTQLQTGFDSPVGVMSCGDNRLFILEQDGRIRIMSKSGVINTTAFLDISGPVQSSGNEQGLLGLAFSPNYKQDGFFYINYIIGNGAGSTRISRFSVNPTDSNLADVNSEVIILEFTQPYTNHNGGNMMFGPDGYLYINQGDGGSGNDPQGNGQNKNTFLGKILRIDVNNQSTYAIPSTNPFVGQANVKEEIWAYGLRNPWRASFDRLTGDMWIGDVGQDAWEEIDFQPASSTGGENYGWRCREGFHVTPAPANTSGCPSTGFVDPVYEVPQAGGTSCSITGGYVYRGAQHNSLFGRYLFTDYCSGRFWAIRKTGANTFAFDTLQSFTTFQYTSFGQDNLGELYICYRGSTSTNGRIYKISETSDCKPVAFITFDDSLSGCAPVNISALKGEGLAYQWYNSTGLINGANSPEYAPIQSGYYKVLVSKPGQSGCESMSDSIYVTIKDTTAIVPSNNLLEFCTNAASFDLTNHLSPTGGVISGSGLSGSVVIPSALSAGVYNASYVYQNTDGCTSNFAFSFEILDSSTITANAPSTVFCNSEAAFTLDGICTPSGGNYSGTAVSNNSFNPALANIGVNNVAYTFTNADGCISSGSFLISVQNCTGTEDLRNSESLMIFPNPNKGTFTLQMESAENANTYIQVTDMAGRIVLGQSENFVSGTNVSKMNLTDLSKGIYYLSVKSDAFAVMKKIMIQ